MRIDKMHEAELERRKGLARRTIFSTVWLGLSVVVAYFLVSRLFADGYLAYDFFYRELQIPNSVPELAIFGTLVLVTVLLMQFILMIGFLFASPAGRQRSGKPSAGTQNRDPLDYGDYR